MNLRRHLTTLVVFISFLGMAIAVWVLSQSMNPNERQFNEAATLVDIGSLAPGELKTIQVEAHGRKLFVFRPTPEVFSDLNRLNPHVWNPNITSYNKEHDLFIYWANSTKFGVDLTHMPKGKSAFEATDPGTHIWLGGYFDTSHDPSYDYAGRTIKTYEYTYNGYNENHPNLGIPHYKFENDHVLLITHP